ncbi:MAG: flagellar assembly protein FliW [Treponema sp.]|nr:flagellar assembly protein FliW [Treponema sp.]
MEVNTKTMGVKSVDKNHLLTIPEGLFGFEDFKNYALIESEYAPFIWLQSLDDATLAFLLIDPFTICHNYEADIDDESLQKISVQSPEDVIVMAVVTVPGSGLPITANLQGPLVINKKNNTCAQVILNDSRWTTKYNIADAFSKTREEK